MPTQPRPFTDFPLEAEERHQHLVWFCAAARLLAHGRCRSLWDVLRRLETDLPPGQCPSYSSLRLLPERLAGLLRLSFSRDVTLYRTRWSDGGNVVGLTDDGREVLRLAEEYLAATGQVV